MDNQLQMSFKVTTFALSNARIDRQVDGKITGMTQVEKEKNMCNDKQISTDLDSQEGTAIYWAKY